MYVHRFLPKYMFSILLSIYSGVELLGHWIKLCLTSEELPGRLSQWLLPQTVPPAVYEVVISPHPHQHWLLSFLMGTRALALLPPRWRVVLPDGLLLQVCVQIDLLSFPLLLQAAHSHCGMGREI